MASVALGVRKHRVAIATASLILTVLAIARVSTFGIGVDYAVNVMSRYVLDGRRDVLAAVRATGGAVALCSATTIVGYSSLLV